MLRADAATIEGLELGIMKRVTVMQITATKQERAPSRYARCSPSFLKKNSVKHRGAVWGREVPVGRMQVRGPGVRRG